MAEKITKASFISLLADKFETSKADSAALLDGFIEELTAQLRQGKSVGLPGLGTFSVKDRAARTGRNPNTGESMQIAASKAPHFKAGKELKAAVNEETVE